uniref:Uncharacterized protein n=1 Tax=Anguilla anguilla TaxID=7936 RepID=A0A0E9W1L5_ANGAN
MFAPLRSSRFILSANNVFSNLIKMREHLSCRFGHLELCVKDDSPLIVFLSLLHSVNQKELTTFRFKKIFYF